MYRFLGPQKKLPITSDPEFRNEWTPVWYSGPADTSCVPLHASPMCDSNVSNLTKQQNDARDGIERFLFLVNASCLPPEAAINTALINILVACYYPVPVLVSTGCPTFETNSKNNSTFIDGACY